MEKHILKVEKRTVVGRKVKQLRKKGLVPANIYGKKVESVAIQIPEKEFTTLFHVVGETGLIELTVDGKMHPVLVHNVQVHPVSASLLHVDFHEVNLSETVTTKVPVVLTGEAKAVKDKAGVLLTLLDELEIEALPMDLPDKIEVDVTNLAVVDDSIKVSMIKLSSKVKMITDMESDVVKVAPLVSKEAEKMATEQAAAEAAHAAAAEGTAPAAEGTPAAAPKKEETSK